ncbi:hypothetical protein [Pararhizobium sp. A13]|uniref:SMa0974 family conjugal transfer regulator n=1 Tax=Pararhizobium sp. A13 TaxID=3133975 RepID=UPI0032513035
MYKHVAEAFVSVAQARYVAEKVCLHINDFCQSIGASESDKLLDFGDGRATLRATDDGLSFRVAAQDLVTFYGIRTLLQGSLSVIPLVSGKAIEWLPAGGVPLGLVRGHVKNGQARTGGQ